MKFSSNVEPLRAQSHVRNTSVFSVLISVQSRNHLKTLEINSIASLLLLQRNKANLFVRVTPCPSCSEQSSIHVRTLADVMKGLESEGDAKHESERENRYYYRYSKTKYLFVCVLTLWIDFRCPRCIQSRKKLRSHLSWWNTRQGKMTTAIARLISGILASHKNPWFTEAWHVIWHLR